MTSVPPMIVTEINPSATAIPSHTDSTVIGVVIALVLLTFVGVAFLLYRYLCHNKGDYRTTGELAPGEDRDLEQQSRSGSEEKKEYFI